MPDCMWEGELKFVYDQDGRLVELFYEMVNADLEYCGRNPIWPETWK